MKLFKNQKDASTSNEAKKPLGQLLKEDLFKALWLTSYLLLMFSILYVLYSALPVFFSYMYSAVGMIIGVDFSSLSTADLVFWAMVSISTGLVFIALLVMMLKKLFGSLTRKMVVNHVFKKMNKESSKVIELKGKK